MYKLIIVDDETLELRLLSRIIKWESLGFKLVATFESADEAIDFLKQDGVDIIISDISMPGLNGLDFLDYVEKNCPNTFFVFLTAHKDFEYVKFALEKKALQYLTKPLNPKDIEKTLKELKKKLDKENAYFESNYIELVCQQALLDYILKEDSEKLTEVLKENKISENCLSDEVAIANINIKAKKEKSFNYGADRLNTALMQLLRLNNIKAFSLSYCAANIIVLIFKNPEENFANYRENCRSFLAVEANIATLGVFSNLKEAIPTIEKLMNISSLYKPAPYNNDHINLAIKYIAENYEKDFSLSDLADYLHLSSFHISKLFKKVTNESFIEYLNRFRLEKAKQMILETNHTILEISIKCGFRNSNNFFRNFKEYTGHTPREYRTRRENRL